MTRKPRRILRRTLAIMLGIYLGWVAADVAFEQVPGPDSSAFGAAAGGVEAAGGHDGHMHSIDALKPGPGHTPWFGKVVFFAVTLFVAAAVLGPVALSLKSPEPPDPADHHDAHDDHAHGGGHGHDAHGHAAAHGHAPAPAAAHGGHGHH